MDGFKITKLLEGRPNNNINIKENLCYDILDNLNINYQRVEYNFFPKNIENLELIDNVIGVEGIKNLIFRTKNNSQFFFIILPREEHFDEKEFRRKHNISKITMSNENEIKELLNTHIGAISIMELENDKDKKIRLFIDEKVLNKKYFRFHPNDNRATIRITTEELKNTLIPYLEHEINIL